MDELRGARGNNVATCEEFFRRGEYGVCKAMVTSLGIWPRERSAFRITVVIILSLAGTISQIIRIVKEWGKDLAMICEIIPIVVTAIGCMLKYAVPVFYISSMEQLLIDMKNNTLELSKLPQYTIAVDYVQRMRKYSIYYVSTIGIFAVLYTLSACLEPVLLDIIQPLNESREKKLVFTAEFFVDERKHYLPVLAFEYVYYFLCVYELLTADVLLLLFVQHICTLYSIAGNYIKHIHILEHRYVDNATEYRQNEYNLKSQCTNEESRAMYLKLKHGIQLFQKASMYCEVVTSTYSVLHTTLVGLNVLLISFTGYQFVVSSDFSLKVKNGSFVVGQLFHLFCICYPGQLILDYSENFYYDICMSSWYLYTKEIRVPYKFLIMRSANFSRLPIGKVFFLGVELYLSIVQMSMSFLTLLLTVQ